MIPAISVILLSPDNYGTIRRTVGHLLRQTIRRQIELVIVTPNPGDFAIDNSEISDFQNVILAVSSNHSVGAAYAAGVRAATAPIVALGEDHSFPRPDWAEILVSAHRGEWAAVGPAIANANPHSVVSRADLLGAYGPWLHPVAAREERHLPGHNSSYKRSILLSYGDQLEAMLEAETVLHWDLRRRGFRLYLESSAITAHTNFELWSSWTGAQYHSGRMFAASRAGNEQWSTLKKLLFAAAWPLIPPVRFFRMLKIALQPQMQSFATPATLATLIFGLMINAAGQFVGTLFGPGSSTARMVELEFHRDLHRRSAPEPA